MLGVSALLLTLAAIPPAWSIRFGFSARLGDVRGGLALAGAIILIECGFVALLLAL